MEFSGSYAFMTNFICYKTMLIRLVLSSFSTLPLSQNVLINNLNNTKQKKAVFLVLFTNVHPFTKKGFDEHNKY